MKNGFLIVKKPQKLTSFDIIRQARKILNTKKIGHAGTLDPFAEGLLILGVEKGTKLLEYIISEDKSYIAKLHLGKNSDTYDRDGEITKISETKPDIKEIQKILKNFQGEIMQTPPAHSAIKINGQRAYSLARKGEKIQIKARKTKVNDIKILNYNYPHLEINVSVISGFYVRSLAYDIGQRLGTGAYLEELNRYRIGQFNINQASEISKENIIPFQKNNLNIDCIDVNEDTKNKIKHGQKLPNPKGITEDIALFYENELICIAKGLEHCIKPHKVLI
ncbi:MAG: tRNA pseudouridine(55) synthase TruB [Candidatus Gracilibacteria bacterium]|jgi:tRNA pseudouridine55 synthase|nr:tRNA pseudouridine(55) synthase TruB [Candidatus Gracilibacteria bacterium]